MAWLISLVVLVGAIFAVFYYWARHRALAAAEAAEQPSAGRVWLLVEALTLIGGGFLLAGGSIAASERWPDISDWGHVAIFLGASALFLGIGLRMRGITQPAAQRVIGLVWLSCSGCAAAATGIAVHDVYQGNVAVTTVACGATIAACSGALWLAFRHEWQMAGLFAGLTITLCGAILTIATHAGVWLVIALGMWALGLGWSVLGIWYPDPLWTSVPLGNALALLAPAFAVWSHGWVFAVGIATAAAAMAISIGLRNSLLLSAGAVCLAGYITAAVARYYRMLFGLPVTLAISGIVVLGIAVATARIWHITRPSDDVPGDLLRKPPRPQVPRTT